MKRQCIIQIIATTLLVGASQASLFDTTASANDDRVIIKSKTFNFRRYASTACRTTNGYTGSRSEGEVERYKNMSGTKCKQKCVQMEEELNGVCFGYEINKGGKCDIWKVRVGDLSDLVVSDDANCYTREGSIVDGVNYVPAIGALAADAPIPPKASFAEFGDYSCRTQDGRGENGREFNTIKKISNEDCNRSCRLVGDDCYGYEYSLSRRSCKLWTEPIEDVKSMRGVNCYIKEGKQAGALSPLYFNDNIDNDGNSGKFAINGFEVDSVQDSSGTDWVLDKNTEWEEKLVNDTGTYDWTEFYRDVNTIKIAEDFKDDRPGYITGKGTIEFDFEKSNVIRCLKNSNNCEKVADIVSVTKGRDPKPFGELPNSNSNNCSPTKEVRITKVAIKRAGSDEGSYQVTFDARKYYPNDDTKNNECNQEDDGYCLWKEDGEEHDIDAPKRIVGENESLRFGTLEDVGKDKDLITEAELKGKYWYVDTCDSYEVIAVSPYNTNAQQRSSCIDVKPKLLMDRDDVFTCENFSVSEITGDIFVWHIEIKPASDRRAFRLFSSP